LVNAEEARAYDAVLRQVPEGYRQLIEGADLLIADGQYTDHEDLAKQGWGHARATTVVDAAVQAGVKQLAIYHHAPMHSDDDVEALIVVCRRRAHLHGSKPSVFGAREGLALRIEASR